MCLRHGRLREAEIEHLHRAVGLHLDVLGFEIAMHDASLVRSLERGGDLTRDPHRLLNRQGPAPQSLGERRSLDQFKDECVNARRRFEAVDCGDVRVIQRREQPRLAREARQPFGICRKEARQDFDRNVAIESRVTGAVHFAHAADAEEVENLINPEPPSGQRRLGRIVHEFRGHRDSRLAEEVLCRRRLRQQRFHFLPQRLVLTGFTQERRPFAGVARKRVMINPRNLLPSLRRHLGNSRRSHVRASFQSRMTVSGEIRSTAAVSSTLRPPKKRNSTTRLLRSSNLASADNASSSATRSSALSGMDNASVNDTRIAPPPRF